MSYYCWLLMHEKITLFNWNMECQLEKTVHAISLVFIFLYILWMLVGGL
jgi:hypothetical protein